MTQDERKVIELALEVLLHAYHEDEAHPKTLETIAAIKEAFAQPETPHEIGQRIAKTGGGISHLWSAVSQDDEIAEAERGFKEALAQPDQDEVDIRSRLYQRIHELETQLAQPTSGDYALGYSIGFGEGHSAGKALAQPEQEPVEIPDCGEAGHADGACGNRECLPSFRRNTTPPQRKPLTDEQMWELWNSQGDDAMEQTAAIAFARDIEAAHNIKE